MKVEEKDGKRILNMDEILGRIGLLMGNASMKLRKAGEPTPYMNSEEVMQFIEKAVEEKING